MRLQAGIGLGEEGQGTLRALAADPATSEYCAARAVGALGKAWPSVTAEATLGRALTADRSELAKACLGWLARFGRPEAESPLLEVLGHHDPEAVVAAAHALGRLGSVAAVATLREAEARWPRELSRAARHAIAEIQSRLTGAEHGQLSLAGAEAGALSLVTETEPGRLSLVEPEQQEPGDRPLGRI